MALTAPPGLLLEELLDGDEAPTVIDDETLMDVSTFLATYNAQRRVFTAWREAARAERPRRQLSLVQSRRSACEFTIASRVSARLLRKAFARWRRAYRRLQVMRRWAGARAHRSLFLQRRALGLWRARLQTRRAVLQIVDCRARKAFDAWRAAFQSRAARAVALGRALNEIVARCALNRWRERVEYVVWLDAVGNDAVKRRVFRMWRRETPRGPDRELVRAQQLKRPFRRWREAARAADKLRQALRFHREQQHRVVPAVFRAWRLWLAERRFQRRRAWRAWCQGVELRAFWRRQQLLQAVRSWRATTRDRHVAVEFAKAHTRRHVLGEWWWLAVAQRHFRLTTLTRCMLMLRVLHPLDNMARRYRMRKGVRALRNAVMITKLSTLQGHVADQFAKHSAFRWMRRHAQLEQAACAVQWVRRSRIFSMWRRSLPVYHFRAHKRALDDEKESNRFYGALLERELQDVADLDQAIAAHAATYEGTDDDDDDDDDEKESPVRPPGGSMCAVIGPPMVASGADPVIEARKEDMARIFACQTLMLRRFLPWRRRTRATMTGARILLKRAIALRLEAFARWRAVFLHRQRVLELAARVDARHRTRAFGAWREAHAAVQSKIAQVRTRWRVFVLPPWFALWRQRLVQQRRLKRVGEAVRTRLVRRVWAVWRKRFIVRWRAAEAKRLAAKRLFRVHSDMFRRWRRHVALRKLGRELFVRVRRVPRLRLAFGRWREQLQARRDDMERLRTATVFVMHRCVRWWHRSAQRSAARRILQTSMRKRRRDVGDHPQTPPRPPPKLDLRSIVEGARSFHKARLFRRLCLVHRCFMYWREWTDEQRWRRTQAAQEAREERKRRALALQREEREKERRRKTKKKVITWPKVRVYDRRGTRGGRTLDISH